MSLIGKCNGSKAPGQNARGTILHDDGEQGLKEDFNMATRFDKFTVKAQEAMQATQEVAGRFGNQEMEPVHLLLALAGQPEGIVPAILSRLGVTASGVTQESEKVRELLLLAGL